MVLEAQGHGVLWLAVAVVHERLKMYSGALA